MSDLPPRVPSDAQWQRLDSAFGTFFLVTLVVAGIFLMAAPFPPLVSVIVMSPLVIPTAWIWIVVIRRRDADRLGQLSAFAARRRRRQR